jgi:TolB-like protein/Flp pilus assembly protein TadD
VLIGAAVVATALLPLTAALVFKVVAPGNEPQGTKPPKIVVLPFENLGSPEDAYFASGMAEELTSRLANVQGLGVISRTTAAQYEHTRKTVKQIGGELGVDYVLEGSVRWEHGQGKESRVRITPQLIRVADDTHVWADQYDRVLADVFAIQSEVAENAVRAMGVRLLPRERATLEEVSTSDLVAYDLYLRGRELEGRGIARAQIEGALQMYQEAVDRDPRLAAAHAGAARMHAEMYWQYYDRSQERLDRVRVAAERAIELRPDLAEAHTALGNYYYRGLSSYPPALKEFAAALEIQPNSGAALEGVGGVLRRQGRWGESAEKFSKASELDPRNVYWLFSVGLSCELAGRYADADRAFAAALELNPQAAENWANRAWLQVVWRGDLDKAQAILDEAARVAGLADDAGFLAMRRLHVALARRDYEWALRQLQVEARGAIDNQLNYWPIAMLRAQVHNMAGHHDLARPSFEAARVELEQRVRKSPNDFRLHSSLGIAYAGLGRKEDAVREARLGCDLMPAAKDAFRAMFALWNLAQVETMVGEHTQAISALDDLLARSRLWTPHVLRLYAGCDPLRSDPRFQALLTKYKVKE